MSREMPLKWHLTTLPLNERSPEAAYRTLFPLLSNDPFCRRAGDSGGVCRLRLILAAAVDPIRWSLDSLPGVPSRTDPPESPAL